ncbi:M48 family metalloprotease [Nevskia sp.]|uniref:M48 family metalloprotease n=1 Tax=Nevskia sp. TaxID=1929292 RepID=UPI0025EC0A5C|nr:M48 family metalloprotease [Nevskia sp.]
MLPVVLALLLIAALRLSLLLRQRAALRPQDQPYAMDLVTQRVVQQLWQQGWPLLLIVATPLIGGTAIWLFALLIAGALWELPPKAYKPFGLDAKHGMNRMTVVTFVREQAIKLALFAALALPAAFLSLELLSRTDKKAWLTIWAIGWGGWAGLRWLQPRWIAPLFDQVEPLPAGELRSRLEALLTRSGVRDQRLYLQKASARSAQANAQVSGSARAPRIVLGDTLIGMLRPDEIEAVVAHELGHIQRGHLRLQLFMIGAASFLMVMIAAALTGGIVEPVARLAIAWALLPSLWLFALPLVNYWYRRFEFEADESAARKASGAALARALRHLTANNRNAPIADRWYERVYHTHPATSERLDRLDRAGT